MRQFCLKIKSDCHLSLKASVGFEGSGILGLDQKQKVYFDRTSGDVLDWSGKQIRHVAVLQQHKWQCF